MSHCLNIFSTLTIQFIMLQGRDISNYSNLSSKQLQNLWTFPQQFDSDIFLDRSNWTDQEISLKCVERTHKVDCSYVEEIVRNNYSSGFIEIAISPVLVKREKISLEQYVRIIIKVPYKPGDMVSIHKINKINNIKPEYKYLLLHDGISFIETDIVYNPVETYEAEYIRENGAVVIQTRYHRRKPSWMWCMRDIIGDRMLNKLFLPGTHDSGSYIRPHWWHEICFPFSTYFDFVFTQENSIYSQLTQGARYLDLRLGKYNNHDSIFYVTHGRFKVRPLEDVIYQVKVFLQLYPHEIIILDIHRFTVGFNSPEDHDLLAKVLKREWNQLIYRYHRYPNWEVTIKEIWKTSGRIIVAYNNDYGFIKNRFYPGIKQIWANADEINNFISYMDLNIPRRFFYRKSNEMTSIMTELTPTFIGIVENKYNGLRELASITNSLITNEFTVGSWGNAAQAVAVDFLPSTGIVTAAIRQNAIRANKFHNFIGKYDLYFN